MNKKIISYEFGQRSGHGIYQWKDMKKYSGSWSKGKQHGIGLLIQPDGKRIKGLWENGKRIKDFYDPDDKKKETPINSTVINDSSTRSVSLAMKRGTKMFHQNEG